MLVQLVCVTLCVTPATPPADTTLTLSRPSVVAFFGMSAQQLDQQPELIEVLADFQFGVTRARAGLESLGLQLHEAYGPNVTLRTPAGEAPLPLGNRLPIGYYFWAPDKPAFVCRGVRTEADILAEAANYREFVRSGAEAALARCEKQP
jgi:hypothetical protein